MSVAMMSNQLTDEQTGKLVRYAKEHAGGRVGLMHDADGPGDDGAKGSLWRLHQAGIGAYLVWSRMAHGGQYDGRQPESITPEEWTAISGSA